MAESDRHDGAEVVRLDRFRKIEPPDPFEWHVPHVYRLTGFLFNRARSEQEYALVASNRPAPVAYALSTDDRGTHAKAEFTQILRLDPTLDRGCVIVRHHANADRVLAFGLKHVDHLLSVTPPHSTFVKTPHGYFTLTHFIPKPDIPEHLLIFVRTRPGLTAEELLAANESACEYLICHPNGTTTTNPNIFYPDPV